MMQADLFDDPQRGCKAIWCNTLNLLDRLIDGGLRFENVSPNSSIVDVDIPFKTDKFVFRLSIKTADNYYCDPVIKCYVIADSSVIEVATEFTTILKRSRLGGDYKFQYRNKLYRATLSGVSPPPQHCSVRARLRELVIRVL